ncbi:AIR synthase-related protein [Bdellovibrio sp. NC01]|uniref:phosphoribosylformylglycinamidine synthase subunit PurL n=1 Tax=Bdellovibrio sp. NC01 TaxID=2220073 RepID=UPI00115A5BB1|nr:AIR synthase-related protein [Bdellovibrio sp. NC01]QDK38834.1 phosphoribosylformylglycinamidine synthase [Bdellovibrio sp. NC01]
MLSQRVLVRSHIDTSAEDNLRKAFAEHADIQELRLSRVFWLLEKTPQAFQTHTVHKYLNRVFCDPISEDLVEGFPRFQDDRIYAEVRFLSGVTDNWARSATEALMLVSEELSSSKVSALPWQNFDIEVHSGWQIELRGDLSQEQIHKTLFKTLANPLLNKVEVHTGTELAKQNHFAGFHSYWALPQQQAPDLKLFSLEFAILEKLNTEKGLALSHQEIDTIIRHFSTPEQTAQRAALGWSGKITEVELECLAQTWSEHCKHKIFAAEVEYSEEAGDFPQLGTKKITSLYKSYIQAATKSLQDCGYLVSVFKDNAGIVDFDENINVCVKVETHNSPSALDPFGGAITGILGVNRDILGCGLGAKPVANMDVFCLSQKDLFPKTDDGKRPELLKDPSFIFRGVHQGVEEGGNQSGIPTINGAFQFASEFAAKPLIFVGSVGVMPKKVQGQNSELKTIDAGDLIVVAGGRLGKDGVHGATFSSLELNDHIASNVVQIGDSITQKRLLDFTMIARDKGLIKAITDNGAGGISSSIGEMAQMSGGARMDLAKHPVKYQGLEFWEMLVSESQERMSFAVIPQNLQAFMALAQHMGVEATCLGEFNSSGKFEIHHNEQPLALLDLHFLHEGLERMKLKAHFAGPKAYQEYHREHAKKEMAPTSANIAEVLKTVLSSPNVASREPLVRYYDHEVQAATRMKPYGGKTQQGANNAGILDLAMHGGQDNNGLAVANGLCPQLSYHDTYLMAQKAVDETIRNLVSAGANPDKIALVDNFCWPDPTPKQSNPDAEHKMAQLVRACAGLYDAAVAYRAPLVSGKDSMKNDFIGKTKSGHTVKISVPPTLLVTGIAQVPDTRQAVTGFFKNAGDKIYLLGKTTKSLIASVFAQEFKTSEIAPEYPDLKANSQLYRQIFQATQLNLLESCHDISEGGLMSAISEACFGNELAAAVNLNSFTWNELWSEMGSLFVVSVKDENEQSFLQHFGSAATSLGVVTADTKLKWSFNSESHEADLQTLRQLWSEGVLNVYHS